MPRTTNPYDINFYEGLVFKTAAMYAPHVQEEFDDIRQRLRIKAWRALQVFDPSRSRMPVDRYVFMCVKNECKDIVKKKRRTDVYIEDQGVEDAQDAFEARYLSANHDQEFGAIDEGAPLVPSTLTGIERQVIVMLYRDYTQAEVARLMGLRRSEMERTMRSIRTKMADWAPSPALALAA
jgi:RNA polymerase sigma factor (sigma-70 family)